MVSLTGLVGVTRRVTRVMARLFSFSFVEDISPPFQLATPPGFPANPIPKKNVVCPAVPRALYMKLQKDMCF